MRALTFVRELRAQCQRITLSPPGYRQRPELGDGIRPLLLMPAALLIKRQRRS